ncbi:hypothetical protein LCGC14_0195810 [marine sediment metagenome]|uniref:Uncharacterized protein n=1 Tax=marine sediment metagenome TaxID=412755 RepID=A0A0F9XNG2_9ZZZZ
MEIHAWETDFDELYKELKKFLKKERLWVIQKCLWLTNSTIISAKRKKDVVDHIMGLNILPPTLKKWKEISLKYKRLTYKESITLGTS